MHWLTQLQQNVVGDINDRIDRANAAATQLLFHPQWRSGLNVNSFHDTAQIARTSFWRVNLNRERVVKRRRDRLHLRHVQRQTVEHGNITGDTDQTQTVGAVRRDADFDSVVVQLQISTDIGANGRVRRQFDDAVVIVGNTQLRERAEHPFRGLATQFGRFDFEITWQHSTYGRDSNFQSLTAVRRATDDIQQAIATDVDFGDTQLVGIGVLAALHDFTNHNAVERTGDGINAVHFQTGHGDLFRQRSAVQGWIYPFA